MPCVCVIYLTFSFIEIIVLTAPVTDGVLSLLPLVLYCIIHIVPAVDFSVLPGVDTVLSVSSHSPTKMFNSFKAHPPVS